MPKAIISEGSRETSKGGSESSLETWSYLILAGGILSALLLLWYSGDVTKVSRYDDWGEKGFDIPYLSLSVYAFLSGLFLKSLMCGASDVVRLLKKQAGIPFAGSISGTISMDKSYRYSCCICGVVVERSATKCNHCDSQIEFDTSLRDDCPSCGEKVRVSGWNIANSELKCPSCSLDLDIAMFIADRSQTCPHCSTNEILLDSEERISKYYDCPKCDKRVDL